ncbi:MAG: hypothetical protein GXP53_07705 [Deltaproteobacteria bacterium]|nr:hypothetical protein [Deltaproteobacteria bacterium]
MTNGKFIRKKGNFSISSGGFFRKDFIKGLRLNSRKIYNPPAIDLIVLWAPELIEKLQKKSIFLTQVHCIIHCVCQIPGCVGHAKINNYLNRDIYHDIKKSPQRTQRVKKSASLWREAIILFSLRPLRP